MKKIAIVLVSIFFINVSHGQTIELELFASGLSAPVDILNAGDERLFVVERRGRIKIILPDGNIEAQPFLDIDPIVKNSNNQSEQGLLGMAFHPEYESNGFFFLHYTDNDGNSNIVRYQVDQNNPNLADESSRELILLIDQPFANHNGGSIKFGPDGFLYIGMGDGGSGNDPINAGQSKNTLLGKMLRIDIDNGLPYTVPEDNPFVNDETTLDEIWALGLRNPWKFSFDRLTGDLWIGDVGQDAFEEISFQAADSPGGENYGWKCYEGNKFTNLTSMQNCQETYVAPVFEVQHQGFTGPCSITGGFVYRGSSYSELSGKYICADYCSGDFYIVEPDDTGEFIGGEVAKFPYNVSSFGEDVQGELYVASFSNGNIYKVIGENVNSTLELDDINHIKLFPNPSEGRTQFEIGTSKRMLLTIQLVDLKGNVHLSKNINVDGFYTEFLEMEGFPSGTYILNIISDTKLLSKKLLVY